MDKDIELLGGYRPQDLSATEDFAFWLRMSYEAQRMIVDETRKQTDAMAEQTQVLTRMLEELAHICDASRGITYTVPSSLANTEDIEAVAQAVMEKRHHG